MNEALAADAIRHNPVTETIVVMLISNHGSVNELPINHQCLLTLPVLKQFPFFCSALRTQQVHRAVLAGQVN